MTHEQAKKELDRGTPAELICATCPWDRLCVEPPATSSMEVEQMLTDARRKDEERDPEHKAFPAASLMTMLTMGGRDRAGALCPVFALRLRGPDGRQVADSIRQTMRTWGEAS